MKHTHSALYLLLLLSAAGLAPSCSGHAPAVDDMAPPGDLAFVSNCGKSGDKGNSLGVGKFCLKLADCTDNTAAFLCTQIADKDNYFCTMACRRDGGVEQCGENATCQCSGGGCGCYPDACN